MAYPNNGGYNNNNSGFHPPPPNQPPMFASTPLLPRPPRPRFAYSGPPDYPRPGSSASKPNPTGSFSELMRSRYVPSDNLNDSMANNYGDTVMDTSLQSCNNSFRSEYDSGGSFQSPLSDSSVYYSCNESFSSPPQRLFPPLDAHNVGWQAGSQNFQSTPNKNQQNRFKAMSSVMDSKQRKPYDRKFKDERKIEWRCALCDITFTSSIPYKMHFQGAKHAKKLKSKEALHTVEMQVPLTKGVAKVGATFRCDICGIVTNGTFQLQTHLDGSKHKSKLAQMEKAAEEKKAEVKKQVESKTKDSKANGTDEKGVAKEKAVISVLPSNPGVSPAKQAPPVKDDKPNYSCLTCNVTLNSELQYEQHISGKYHKAKTEGNPLPWKKNFARKAVKKSKQDELEKMATEPMEQPSGTTNQALEPAVHAEVPITVTKTPVSILKNKKTSADTPKAATGSAATTQTVVGVKTLSSSFIAGGTM